MFGFQGGESQKVVAHKKNLMKSAQKKWHFLTNFDCSTIKTKGQLHSIVTMRSGRPEEQVRREVDAWLKDNAV